MTDDATSESEQAPTDEDTSAASRRRLPWYATAGWVVAVLCLTVAFLGWIGFQSGTLRWIYRDGDAIWDSADQLQLRSVLWSPPRELPDPAVDQDGEPVADDTSAPLSATSLLVAHRTARGDYDIYVRQLTQSGWLPLAPLGGPEALIHSDSDEITPALSADGTTLFFASNRKRGLGGYDLYASKLTGDGWQKPVALGSHVNSPFDELGPAPDPSGRVVAFATNRPRGFLLAPPQEWDDVPLAGWEAVDFDIAFVVRDDPSRLRGGWSDPEPLDAVNSDADDTTPAFAPRGNFVYFSSRREGGSGGLDLYRSRCHLPGIDDPNEVTRLTAEEPENVGPTVNSAYDDSLPYLFLEGFALAYRVEDADNNVAAHFESRSHEVAPELSVDAIPLETVTAYAVEIGGLVIGGVLLLAAGWALLRYRRFWALNLTLRCALAAVFVHVVMFYGFYFWRLGSTLSQFKPKTVLAEVTIEKTLTARLSMETQHLDIELPDDVPDQVVEAKPSIQASPMAAAAATSVEREVFDAAPHLKTVALTSAVADVRLQPAPVPDPTHVRATSFEEVVRSQNESVALATPSPSEEAEPTVDPEGANSSLKAEFDTPRAGPVSSLVAEAASAPNPAPQVLAQAAKTQVHAPDAPVTTLPPVARAAEHTTEVISQLPVPAQSSQQESAAVTVARPADRKAPDADTNTVAQRPEATRLPVQTTPTETPHPRWTSAPSGVTRAMDIADAKSMRLSPLRPADARPAAAKRSAQLPESTPIASSESAAQPDELVNASRPSARRDQRSSLNDNSAAPLLSSRDLPEMLPRTAPSTSKSRVTAAAPTPLDSVPTPGTLAAADLSANAERSSRTVQLPDGEAGREGASGATEVADVLGPKKPTRRAPGKPWSGPSPKVARPTPALSRRPHAPAPASATEAGQITGGPRRAITEPDTDVGRPGAEAVTSAARPVAALIKLPETAPGAKKHDLRKVRSTESRRKLVRQMGGTRESESAVKLGLQWLARNQSSDGRWDVDGFLATCPGCGSPGFHTKCDVAITGLAILCFLGQNHTHTSRGSPYAHQVARAIQWLVAQQDPETGVLAGEDRKYVMYNHGIATLALSEAYILSQDKRLEQPLRAAGNVILKAQNPSTGGWRYQPEPPIRGDTSISGWQIMALTSLRNAGFRVPDVVFDRSRHWLDVEVSGGRHNGIYGYTTPEEPRAAMVAEGMFVRQLLGAKRTDANIEEAARYVHTHTREGEYLDNLYLLYYGTLGLYQYQGWIWERWNNQVRDFLVESQHKSGLRAGSWDPTDAYSEGGGRLLSTCFAILTLEVYYRYLPLFWDPEGE